MSFSKEKKTKILLIFPFDLMSHYLRCISLAKDYPDYTILFQASDKYNHFVKLEGFKTFECAHFDAKQVMADIEKFRFNWLNKNDIERVFLSQVETIQKYKPSLVIGDTAPALKMACEYTNVAFTSVFNGYMSKYYTLPKPLTNKLLLFRLVNKLPERVKRNLIKEGETIAFYRIHQPFKELRKKYGLSECKNYLDELEGNQNFICDSEMLFPQTNQPANYKIIGPLLFKNDRNEAELISQFLPDKKTICISMGSSGNWKELEFLSHEKYSVFNIITAGDTNRVLKGQHILARDFVNLDAILPHCNCLVCHGGNGTIYLALQHKVPLLCFPSHFEQEWNASRIEDLGLGVNLRNKPKDYLEVFLFKQL